MQVDLFLIRIGAPLCSQVMVIDFYVSGQGMPCIRTVLVVRSTLKEKNLLSKEGIFPLRVDQFSSGTYFFPTQLKNFLPMKNYQNFHSP